MTPEQQRAVLSLALLAAFADGEKHDREREEIRRIAEALANETGAPDLARLYQDVLLKRTGVEAAVAALDTPELRQLAYEMAVCVCNADGRESEAERRFLADLTARLHLDGARVEAIAEEADVMANLSSVTSPAPVPGPPTAQASVTEAELDKSILNYALLNGALELLPQSWASMAIIPLQIRMVHAIGQAHGYALDQGHIKEFIAAAGVGLTSQYLEQFGRKLLGGLLGRAAGKAFGKAGSAATGMAFSFATTYALGQVAKRYYAGGRSMNTELLRETFQGLLGPARQMQAQYLPRIEQQARTLDMGQVMNMARGF